MSETCHYASQCPFYKNFTGFASGDVVAGRVIVTSGDEKYPYDCTALASARYPGTGIHIGEELRGELSDRKKIEITMKECPLNRLNSPEFLENILEYLTELKHPM